MQESGEIKISQEFRVIDLGRIGMKRLEEGGGVIERGGGLG
jgi:hypothetical protein